MILILPEHILEVKKKLHEIGAPNEFIIHTKAVASFRTPGTQTKEGIIKSAKESLADLGVNQVETYFLHSPDKDVPITETLEGIQQVFKEGKFKYFGISNFNPKQTQEVYDITSSKGYVLPTVYQGNYNPIARHHEDELFPLLRKLNIRFYAYSPVAGGFLVRTPQQIKEAKEGRFDNSTFIGQVYHKLYSRPALIDALEDWEKIAQTAGISKAALAIRWVAWNSILDQKHGDGIIFGASSTKQLKETLDALNAGPLEKNAIDSINQIWQKVKHEAPIDNFNY